MQLETQVPVMLGDRVSVALSDTQTLEARVVWSNGDDCGLRFDERIDSAGALRRAAEEARDTQARQPRLPIDRAAVGVSADGMRPVRVCDVSHRGMKIAHQASFTPGRPVKVILGSGVARRGVVRWSRDGYAGVLLTETFAVRELGRLDEHVATRPNGSLKKILPRIGAVSTVIFRSSSDVAFGETFD